MKMKTSVDRTICATCLAFIVFACSAQTKKQETQKIDRLPAVAGSFYPANKPELETMIEDCFNASNNVLSQQPLAMIVPHAGYVFSGGVAASAFKQIDRQKKFDCIFIIGSSHTMHFNGASVYTKGNFITPLGKVPVDPLATSLANNNSFISTDVKPHEQEHSLEVQLPFLQYWLMEPFSIVPIIIGGNSKVTCNKLAKALKPYFNAKSLFVISSDFSHYPAYSEATLSDNSMADAIVSNSSQKFLDTKHQMENKGIANLATAACGWTSILTLLEITEDMPGISYKKILYENSGDSQYGGKNRVVGYYSICAVDETKSQSEPDFKFTDENKVQLLQLARNTVDQYILVNTLPEIEEKEIPENLRIKTGAFVTLTKGGKLRGCIGRFKPQKSLYHTVRSMAVSAAFHDYRFHPVEKKEIPDLEIEISVLTPMKKINSIEEIEMGNVRNQN